VDKDSDKRQRIAIQRFAKSAGCEIVAEYYDAAVSGADPVQARPGFAAMLDRHRRERRSRHHRRDRLAFRP
jgi:DNA invertase Pin-like site-specific DNA recombinase